MADQYYTYTPPAKTAVPAGALPDYSPYVNNNGTISNTKTGTVYTNPTQLAGDLGINASTIDWSKIALGGAAGYAADQATAPGSPTNPNTPIPLPPTTSINSSNTAPQNPITPVAPVTTPVPNVSGLGSVTTPTLQITPQEQQAQDITTRLTQLNDSLVGKSAYQTQENTAFGVDTAQKTITDLGAQLTGLKNEAASIPLQLQQGAADRGVTTPVLGRQENSRLRTNAIAALGVSSLMAAAQGQLANAQALADKAVAAKYDPIQEEINAKTANLKLIINSPEYSIEDKNRAQAQLDSVKKQQDALDQQKQNASDIQKIAIQAAADGADAVTLQNIQNATSPVQAAQMYATVQKQKTAAVDLKTAGITTPYARLASGEVLNTATGYSYQSEADFQQKTGRTIGNAQAAGLVSAYTPPVAVNKDLSTLLVSAASAGAPIDLVNKAKATNDPIQAAALLNKYLHTTNEISPNSTNSQVTTVGGTGIVAGVKVPADIANDVEDVLTGRNTLLNIRQTMGRTNAAAAYMKEMRAAIKSIDPNFDFIASDAGGKFASSTFYQKAISAITSVEPNIDKVVALSDQVSRIGIKGVDAILQQAAIQIGNQTVTNFHEAQKLIADEIGLALGQGAVSDMKLQLGFDVTDPSVNPEIFASNMKLVKEFLDNRKKALTDQRYSSSVVDSNSGGDISAVQAEIKSSVASTYPTRELLISALQQEYPNIPADQIANQVYTLIPDKK